MKHFTVAAVYLCALALQSLFVASRSTESDSSCSYQHFAVSDTCFLQKGECSQPGEPAVCVHGQCKQINSTDYRCYCGRGYSGIHCDYPVNECVLRPCRNNASCVNAFPHTGFRCLCPPLFAGVYCETLIDSCGPETCLHNATCQPDDANGFRCFCSKGFTGRRCEKRVDECASLPCFNDGVCKDTLDGYECRCEFPYVGRQCETTLCGSDLSNPCQNGNCVIDTTVSGGFKCECAAGFTGTFCDEAVDVCSGQSCSNHGLCVNDIASYQCLCVPGWTGKNCESQLDQCFNNRCQHGASCHINNDGYICQCPAGYQGRYCETLTDHCEQSPCIHGHCINLENSYSCLCEEGWQGMNCTGKNCTTISCLNGGVCVETETGPICRCTEEWIGNNCDKSKNPCHSLPCRNGGLCAAASASENGYECGYYCEFHIDDCGLSQATCLNGGTCVDAIANFTCICPSQYAGWRCEIPLVSTNTNPSTTRTVSSATTTPNSISPTPVQSVDQTTPSSPTKIFMMMPDLSTFPYVTSLTSSELIIHANEILPELLYTTLLVTSSKETTPLVSSDFFTPTPTISFALSVPSQTTVMPVYTSLSGSDFVSSSFDSVAVHSDGVSLTDAYNNYSFPTLYATMITEHYEPISEPASYFRSFGSSASFPEYYSVSPILTAITAGILQSSITPLDSLYSLQSGVLSSYTVNMTYALPSTITSTSTESTSNAADPSTIPSTVASPPAQMPVSQAVMCPKTLCRNGGTCYLTPENVFGCNCVLGFYGNVCENEIIISRATFTGRSLLRYAGVTISSGDALEISIRLAITDVNDLSANSIILHASSSQHPDIFSELILDSADLLRFRGGCGDKFIIDANLTASLRPKVFSTVTFRHSFPTQMLPTCSLTIKNERNSFSRSYSTAQIDNSNSRNAITEIDSIFVGGRYAMGTTNFSGVISNFAIGGHEKNFHDDPLEGRNIRPTLMDTCSSRPCRNNATCLESYSGWMCSCLPEFTGEFCELSVCKYNPCVGGSTCIPSGGDAVRCVCPLGRYGKYCEKTYDMQNDERFFANALNYSSYISFAPIKNASDHLEIRLNVTFPNVPADLGSLDGSLLLLIGYPDLAHNDYDFLMLGFANNQPALIYNLGGGALMTPGSGTLDVDVADHSFHIYFDSEHGTFLSVDSTETVVHTPQPFPADYVFRNFDSTSRVFVGGFDIMDGLPLSGFHAFNGSIASVQFRTRRDGDFVSFSNLLDGRNVLPSEFRCTESAPIFNPPLCNNPTSENVALKTNSNACVNSLCSQDATCVPDMSSAGYHCDCPLGKSGNYCQQISRISDATFNGENSFLKFGAIPTLQESSSIEMQVMPNGPDGLLFYVAEYPTRRTVEFLSAFLVNWTVNFRFNVGTSFAKALIANVTVKNSEGIWAFLSFGRNSSLAWLTVNNNTITTDLTNQTQKLLDTFTGIYIGGVPNLSAIGASAVYGLPQSFDGCIRELVLNGKRLHLDSVEPEEGLNVNDCDGTSCGYQSCDNGGLCEDIMLNTTHNTANTNGMTASLFGYRCECPREYFGENCQYPTSCTEDHQLQYIDNITFCPCPSSTATMSSYSSCTKNVTLDHSGFFDKGAYLSLVPSYFNSNKSVTFISFRFRTTREDGLILWTGKVRTLHSDYLGVGIAGGYITVVWNLGWNSRGTLTSPQFRRIDDGLWHEVIIFRVAQKIQVIVDLETSVIGISPGIYADLETDGVFYIGSFPYGLKIMEETMNYFTQSFRGCITDLKFDAQANPVSFSQDVQTVNVIPCDS
ncbi:protein eyes shut homolog isoform X2 [Paramacrobiotus metropolitanus]|uniref:protein eyes shut homolog isoform X2 n=1 Tax=Paramacrobiotus metropolitanus TaxID=2943436 RepID=UPI002445EE9C|nr:protein eyes shut homolog isoform X2 [Paramacrobiotus metropolitanus]